MKALVVVALIHGLVPALGELVEASVHYVTSGHLAHSDADHGDLGDQGAEHGCSPTDHHCACCSAQPVVAPPAPGSVRSPWRQAGWLAAEDGRETSRSLAPPFRPPIA